MTNEELKNLWCQSIQRFDELVLKYEMGFGLTRQDCIELRECNRRLRTVCFESWVLAGKPRDPEFEIMWNHPPEQPYPWAMPLDLTGQPKGGIN